MAKDYSAAKLYTMQDLHAAIVKHPEFTPLQIAELIGCSQGAVRQYVRRHKLQCKVTPAKTGRPKGAVASKPYIPKARKTEKPLLDRPPMKPGMMGGGRAYTSSYTKVL